MENWLPRMFQGIFRITLKSYVKPRINYSIIFLTGRGSSVGIATRYGLDGPGIESRWGRDFPHPSSPALGPTRPPIQ